MLTFLRRRPRKATPATVDHRLIRLERGVGKLTRTRVNVRRDEHDEAVAARRQLEQQTNDLERHTCDRETHFKRIAQIQADLDVIKPAWTNATIR